jgi:hypothetical protein
MLYKNSICGVVGRSVVFNVEKVTRREPGLYCEMSSFPETKAERLMFGVNGDPAMFLWFHRYRNEALSPAWLRKFLVHSLRMIRCIPNYLLLFFCLSALLVPVFRNLYFGIDSLNPDPDPGCC